VGKQRRTLEGISFDERHPPKMFRQMSILDWVTWRALAALVQAGSNYTKSVHAGTACTTKRARGCQADFGGEGMYWRGENHDRGVRELQSCHFQISF
jgi:hypothetical protein